MIKPFNPVVRSLINSAGIAIRQKQWFKNRGKIVIKQMMDDAVAEFGSENFPFYRFVRDKRDTFPNFIFPVYYFLVKLK